MHSSNPSKAKSYEFNEISACVMCGDSAEHARTLGIRLNRSQGMFPRKKTGIAVSICRCRTCGLIYSNPQPKPKILEDHYGIPPEEYWAEDYIEYKTGYFERQILSAKKHLNFIEGMRALDIGIGLGHAALSMKYAGFDVYGIEPSRHFYDKAMEVNKFNRENFILSSVEDAYLPTSFFDFITFGAVLEHLYDPALAIDKSMTWLKPGGIVHIEVPNSDYLVSKIINTYFTLSFTNYVTNLSPMHSPFHLFEFSLESFKRHARRSNYSIAEHWIDVMSIWNMPKFLHPILRGIMERNGSGNQLTVFIRK